MPVIGRCHTNIKVHPVHFVLAQFHSKNTMSQSQGGKSGFLRFSKYLETHYNYSKTKILKKRVYEEVKMTMVDFQQQSTWDAVDK